jgi:hypothetical protein
LDFSTPTARGGERRIAGRRQSGPNNKIPAVDRIEL